ncbi:MAG TPA: EAL domain-containing protein [Acidimicrobiales bacterium]|nr:EAL domain-containing protein [Acidimicrobiales bacterium]
MALWAGAGLVTVALSLGRMITIGWPGAMDVTFAAVFCALLAATWIWPITLYFDGESDAIDFDEAFFVLLVLLVPSAMTVLVFTFVTIAAQAIKRRPLMKSIFNVGQVVTSVGVGALAFTLLHGAPEAPIGYASALAALAGAACYLAVNTTAMVSIMATLGTPWRRTVFGGLKGKLLVSAGGIGIAVPTALLLARDPKYLPVALLPLFIVRYLGTGQFDALHDRARLLGLFEATLDVNRSMGTEETKAAVLKAAGTLLRSPEVALTATRPVGVDGLCAPMEFDDRTLWLGVTGRSRTEPFDDGDRALLHALASVGAIALSNAHLYGEVRRQRENLSAITSSLGEGVCAISEAGDITFMNPAGASMLGWYTLGPGAADEGPVVRADETPRFLLDPAMRAIALGRNVTSYDTRFERPDGSHFPVTVTASPVVGGSSPSGAVIVFRDTSERKAFEEQLARHAFQDALTGLANRRLLLDHLDHALLQADRAGSQVAVLFCDIDRFKVVNDHLGHQVGDELLRVVGDRLRRAVRPGDTLSRFGGDEFVILLEGVYSPDDAIEVVNVALDALRDPVILSGGHELVATMSIGIALSEYGKSRDDLLHDADVAMYRAKERGRGGQYALFDAELMGGRSVGRLDLDTALHHVVERDEIEVVYQPLVSLADRRIVGAEALVRWNHPDHGLLLPSQFIQLAEDNGTILPIGRAVLEQACLQARTWHETHGQLQVGVNLSARQFQQDGLAEEIASVIQATSVDPSQLCFEITETLAMDDVDLTSAILARLHTLGVQLAIDDFGTGHSSLGYLARFPIDVVKIDQSFVHNIDRDPVKSAIVSAVVALSQAIGSTTVVEGVETVAQLEELKNLGCDVAQGFYFARPVSAASFDKLLEANANPAPDLRVVRGALAG